MESNRKVTFNPSCQALENEMVVKNNGADRINLKVGQINKNCYI